MYSEIEKEKEGILSKKLKVSESAMTLYPKDTES